MSMTKTRRAVLAGAAALPALAAPAAFASISPTDPIFAAIERHQRLWAEYVAICERDDLADGKAHDVACYEAGSAQSNALTALVSETPTTLAGCAALLRYVDHAVAEAEQGQLFEGFTGAEDSARDLLTRVASVLATMAVQS